MVKSLYDTNHMRELSSAGLGEFGKKPEIREVEPTAEILLERDLREHVVDIKPGWMGSDKHRALAGQSPVAAMDATISRCDPPLELGTRFILEPGKSIVLVGPNGAGKSTLLDAIMDRRHARFDSGSHGYGKGVHGKETLRVSRLDQEELLSNIQHLTAAEVLELTRERYKDEFPVDWEQWEDDAIDRNNRNQEAQQRIDELVSQVTKLFEMEEFLERKVGELSGGERTKLSLLMTLASEPDVLLLDEPTNHLDLESIAKLTGLFDTYKRAGVSLVNVSHVEWFLDMVGEDGTIELAKEKNRRSATQSNAPYRTFKKREKRRAAIEGSISWSKLGGKKDAANLFETSKRVTIPDSPLKDITPPNFYPGDITMLSGKNGTGKTKLMEALAKPERRLIAREKGVQTAYLPQLWPKKITEGTVQDFFVWVKDQTNAHSDILASRLSKELRDIGFGSGRADLLSEKFGSFSGGEQRLLWFAAASLLEGTDALILDEPSNHMDEPTMEKIVEAIRNFPGAVILSTHDLRLMEALEKYPGPTREGKGIRNLLFTRTEETTTIEPTDVSPLNYAKETIKQARKTAGRVKVT